MSVKPLDQCMHIVDTEGVSCDANEDSQLILRKDQFPGHSDFLTAVFQSKAVYFTRADFRIFSSWITQSFNLSLLW